MDMCPPTPHELENLPHVFLTDDSQWDPSLLDDEFHDSNDLPSDPEVLSRRDSHDPRVNDTGSINHICQIDELHFFDAIDPLPLELTLLEHTTNALLAFPQRVSIVSIRKTNRQECYGTIQLCYAKSHNIIYIYILLRIILN